MRKNKDNKPAVDKVLKFSYFSINAYDILNKLESRSNDPLKNHSFKNDWIDICIFFMKYGFPIFGTFYNLNA